MSVVVKLLLFVAVLVSGWRFFDSFQAKSEDLEPLLTFIGFVVTYLAAEVRADTWFRKKQVATPRKPPSAHDVALYKALVALFPADTVIYFFKNFDFGNSFEKSDVDTLFRFAHEWDNVDHEFIDQDLEPLRKDALAKAQKLGQTIARNTVPNRQGRISVTPDSLPPGPYPEHLVREAREINDVANEFTTSYEALVRQCKLKLLADA